MFNNIINSSLRCLSVIYTVYYRHIKWAQAKIENKKNTFAKMYPMCQSIYLINQFYKTIL